MRRLLLLVVAGSALWTVACGGGSSVTPPPPTGKYSNASLNGTYAFVTSGETIVNTVNGPAESPMVRTGSFIADGSGHIQGGVYDLVVSGVSSTTTTAPIPISSGGSYSINADGRGTLTLNVQSGGGPASINFGIVLTSTNGGLMIDETFSGNQASTGSGNFILQNSATFASGVSGSYVFDFSGLDANFSSSSGSGLPESLLGQFTASGGTITSGFEDVNDDFTLSSGSIAGGGNFALDPSNTADGRGTAMIEGQTYAFYIVDSSRVRFISLNGPMLTGDAVAQSNIPANLTAINSGFVFLTAGSNVNGGLIRVGRFNVSGGTVSKILMDVNNAANETSFTSFTMPSITYDPAMGRGVVSFQASLTNVFSFVFYLSSSSSGVIQDVSPSDSTTPASQVADGSILEQTGGPFTSANITGPYAMNWSGLVTATGFGSTDEEDLLSQVTVSNLSLSGTSDIFQFTGPSLTTNIGTGGSINFNSGDGTGDDGKSVSMVVQLSQISPIRMVVYVVNPQLAFFVNTNQSGTPRIVAGILEVQQ